MKILVEDNEKELKRNWYRAVQWAGDAGGNPREILGKSSSSTTSTLIKMRVDDYRCHDLFLKSINHSNHPCLLIYTLNIDSVRDGEREERRDTGEV